MRLLSVLIVMLPAICSNGQQAQKTFYIGHSLINLNIPAMVHSLAGDAGISEDDYDYQIGNGANLLYQWDTTTGNEQGTPYEVALPTGQYDNLIMTEAIALKSHIQWSGTFEYANNFCQFAHSFNPDIRMYIYETWHCINSGTEIGCPWDDESHIDWRQRLTADLPVWESIADHVLSVNPDYRVYLVPGGQGMARLYDAILSGGVPGISSIRDLYTDDIHLTNEGNYYIACILFSCIYGQSPEGLTNQVYDEWGGAFPLIDGALALRLQQLAWETVCSYGRSGVECDVSGTRNVASGPKTFFYDFTTNSVRRLSKDLSTLEIRDISGRITGITSFDNDIISLDHLNPGIYILSDGLRQVEKIVVSR